MRSLTRWAGASVAVLGLLVGAAGPAGAEADGGSGGRRIAGSFAGEGEFVNEPCAVPEVPDHAGIGVSFTASAHLSSLGASDVEGIVCLHPRDGRSFGPLTLSAGRSTITGDMVGAPGEAPFPPFTFRLDYTVSGGTGRFAGARGTLSVVVTVDIAPIPMLVDGTIDGRVTVPHSAGAAAA
jgi:hypothetical protein